MQKHCWNADFSRISFHRAATGAPPAKVHAVVKHRPILGREPKLFDTFYYTVPVRSKHMTDYENMILTFSCPSQASIFCTSMNARKHVLPNMCEPSSHAITKDVRYEEITHDGCMLGMSVVIVNNAFCANQKEPFYEVFMIPYVDSK